MTFFSPQIIIGALSALVLILAMWAFVIERRLRKLLAGKNAQSLEGTICALGADIRALEKFQTETTNYLAEAEKRIKRSVQGVETIRFNAFKGNGEGGNQSFAVALLSEDGDGAVISSLYARDRVSVFAKPVTGFTSQYEMTEEEKSAVAQISKNIIH